MHLALAHPPSTDVSNFRRLELNTDDAVNKCVAQTRECDQLWRAGKNNIGVDITT